MNIGILSDSHGDGPETARAIALLNARGAKKLVHCGDLCGINVLDELAGHDSVFVWGNCDDPDLTMRRYVAAIGLPWPEVPVTFEAAGKRFAVFHGHEPAFAAALRSGEFDYVLHGHSHQFAYTRDGNTRIINPGALHRARIHTVGLLVPVTGELRILDVATGHPVLVRSE
ncbi:MAG: YfcE family phosphodiesterase [Phycisphaerae bacterium]|nr:YfcE family phosphodiesterase [Phycisphaerae bacterium]